MSTVRLRGNAPRRRSPYDLGTIPDSVIKVIGRKVVHLLAIGRTRLSGNDFADMFAAAVEGFHRAKPLGIADVEWGGCAWSVKTVQAKKPFTSKAVRLISGRNAPVYSQGILEPFADIQRTGTAVLEIWNERVNEAFANFDDLRVLVLIRNMTTLEFVLAEHEAHRYPPSEFIWSLNSRRNLIGREPATNKIRFTWQPSGSQFTIHHDIPISIRKFRILHRPQPPNEAALLESINFEDSWIQTVP